MIDWLALSNIAWLVIGLMPGVEEEDLVSRDYNLLPRSHLLHLTNAHGESYVYSVKLDKFWRQKAVPLKELHGLKFGLTAEGIVVSGADATEITLESRYALCSRSPYGARKKVREYYGKSGI